MEGSDSQIQEEPRAARDGSGAVGVLPLGVALITAPVISQEYSMLLMLLFLHLCII